MASKKKGPGSRWEEDKCNSLVFFDSTEGDFSPQPRKMDKQRILFCIAAADVCASERHLPMSSHGTTESQWITLEQSVMSEQTDHSKTV